MHWRLVWRRARSLHATAFSAVLIVFLAIAYLVVPLAGEAQQAASLLRIGLLLPSSLSAHEFRLASGGVAAGEAQVSRAVKSWN